MYNEYLGVGHIREQNVKYSSSTAVVACFVSFCFPPSLCSTCRMFIRSGHNNRPPLRIQYSSSTAVDKKKKMNVRKISVRFDVTEARPELMAEPSESIIRTTAATGAGVLHGIDMRNNCTARRREGLHTRLNPGSPAVSRLVYSLN